MASATSDAPEYRREHHSGESEAQRGAEDDGKAKKKEAGMLARFWTKLSNDGAFNLAGTLAYSLETSIFSILLVIIAIGGLLLGHISLVSRAKLENGLAGALPGGAGGAGGQIVRAATHSLNTGAPVILILGIVAALVGGSGLFVTMEYAFGVIFRLRGRDFLHQRLMAIGMLLIFVVLVPIILLASAVPPVVLKSLGIGASNPVAGFFIQVLGLVAAFISALIFFALIYIIVPNRPVKANEVVNGTLVAAALLVAYETLFPLYESLFLHPGSYGSLVGFAVVIIAFFYYLAFIILVGAEVNSWAAGQRETAAPIDAILHELQAHNTTRGAAGPTAGQPYEDLQDGKGASAMDNTRDAIHHERVDHRDDAQPPKFAESGTTGSGYRLEDQEQPNATAGQKLGQLASAGEDDAREEAAEPVFRSGARVLPKQSVTYAQSRREQVMSRPMTGRQKTALAALAISGGVALAGVVRIGVRLLSDDDDAE